MTRRSLADTIRVRLVKSRSTRTSAENTTRPPHWPYLNAYHKKHSEEAMAEISNRPSVSAKEAYDQYDRLKAAAQKAGKRSARKSTLLSKGTT